VAVWAMTKRAAPERRRDALRRTLIRTGITETRRREALVVALYGAVWYRLWTSRSPPVSSAERSN